MSFYPTFVNPQSKKLKVLGACLKDIQVQIVHEHAPFARVTGVDLRCVGPLDREALQQLMQKHTLLIFPDQELMPEDELRVNQAFGYHEDNQKEFSFGFNVEIIV